MVSSVQIKYQKTVKSMQNLDFFDERRDIAFDVDVSINGQNILFLKFKATAFYIEERYPIIGIG
jgi:hypothetical protein